MGLGSIVGTGVFVSIGLGAGIAGRWVVLAIVVAAVVATANGLSSAELAASHPVSGGTYEYGYRYLSPVAGFAAGWLFLVAKSASAATAALGFAGYAWLLLRDAAIDEPPVALALGAVVAVTVVVLTGIRRSNVANTVIVSVTIGSLIVFVVAALLHDGPETTADPFPGSAALLEAAALMFVAYTGYGRIATLGEEVREPRRIIPRAVIITLAVSAVLYVAVAAAALSLADAATFAELAERSGAPLEALTNRTSGAGIGRVVAIGAVTAMLGVLLNLVLGLSRVLLAMGRRRDMPPVTARLDAARTTPWVAVLVVAVIITALVVLDDITTAWSLSAVTVLLYYATTNLAALRLTGDDKRFPRFVSAFGLVGCVVLAFTVDPPILVAGLVILAAGLVWFVVADRIRQAHEEGV
jgi:APA family basic amino acid/polyamine antiporter